jgi:hypothetical protein
MAKPTSTGRERGTRVTAAFAVLLALGIVAVLAILVSHVVVGPSQTVAGHHGKHQQVSGPGAPGAPAKPQGSPLRLVTGTNWVNGIYTSYPRSQAGAVSAAVEFITELGSTLDPDRAATVARLTADRSYQAAAQDGAASAVAARHALGLPSSGPLPEGTGAFLVPVMYQVQAVSAGQLTVLLLYNYTLTAQSGVAEHVGVTAVRLTWTPASWRMLTPPAHDLAALLATPGTTDAAAKGWEAMTDGL